MDPTTNRCWASSGRPARARSRSPIANWRSYVLLPHRLPPAHASVALLPFLFPNSSPSHDVRTQKWHPDKNLGNDDATAIFQQIQEANSVLSDPRERSWYDSHRDEILRGDDGDEDGDGEAYVVNVWPYFSGAAFSGYEDGAGGFYDVYRSVFEVRAHRRC